jgi:nucleotide-binding universal stress UspA family protein
MYGRILVPIDGSDCANAGLREIATVASRPASKVLLLHVIEQYSWDKQFGVGTVGAIMQGADRQSGEAILDVARNTLRNLGILCETILAEAHGQRTSQVIVAHAQTWKADLIVMGTHGRRGVGQMVMGSDAVEVVRVAATPVLLVSKRGSRGPSLPDEEQPKE